MFNIVHYKLECWRTVEEAKKEETEMRHDGMNKISWNPSDFYHIS